MRAFIQLKRFIAAFFIVILWKPLKYIFVFLFDKIIVKLYCRYLDFAKKIGLTSTKERILIFLIRQKLVHVLVAVLTIMVVFTNLANNTRAEFGTDNISNTIMAHLVQSEFGDLQVEELTEEYVEEGVTDFQPPNYFNSSYLTVEEILAELNKEIINEDAIITKSGEALVKPELATTQIIEEEPGPRTETIYHEVRSGDSISTIAEKYGLTVNTVLWANDLTAYSMIRPGQKLKILPVSGVEHTVAKGENLGYIANKYDVEQSEILKANELEDSSILKLGQELLIPGASKIQPVVVAKKEAYIGITAIKNLVAPEGTRPAAGNKMNWPTVGQRISQYFSWRHSAVDIANKTGTPIYAADAGKIIFAGWGSGYGNRMDIDHGGGKITRYAHLSQFYVEVGDKVDKGQTIAAMGSTGWSTGPHLHFEVIIGGKKLNPLNYIK